MAEYGGLLARVHIRDHPAHDKFLVVHLLEGVTALQLAQLEIAVRVPVCVQLSAKVRGGMSEREPCSSCAPVQRGEKPWSALSLGGIPIHVCERVPRSWAPSPGDCPCGCERPPDAKEPAEADSSHFKLAWTYPPSSAASSRSKRSS